MKLELIRYLSLSLSPVLIIWIIFYLYLKSKKSKKNKKKDNL